MTKKKVEAGEWRAVANASSRRRENVLSRQSAMLSLMGPLSGGREGGLLSSEAVAADHCGRREIERER